MTRSTSLARLLGATALLAALPALAHDPAHDGRKREYFQPGAAFSGLPGDHAAHVPFHRGLAALPFPVTTASADAQRYVDQGMALVWGFNHAEAVRSFRAAQTLDPACAMCFWGEALALGPNLNDTMAEEAIVPAWAAIERARALSAGATDREQALVDALSARYGINAMVNRRRLDIAWADAIGAVAARWPEDADIATLHADALMNLQPWDYWEADGVTPKGKAAAIVVALEHALDRAPDHIGALHLYIHAVEASTRPERAEAAADRLRALAPATGHLLHMPAHIYARVGRHADSIAVNRAAIEADEAFLAEVGPAASPLWRHGYAQHNIHYLLVSAQMTGQGDEAIAAADRLAGASPDRLAGSLAWVQAIRTAPYTAHALFSAPETILALPEPGADFPFVVGFWHYARGIGQVRAGNLAAAEAEATALQRLIDTADLSMLEAQFLPAGDILAMARDMVRARAAWARGDLGRAEALVRGAIALEDRIGYMEPPYWYYPLRQTLGAVLLAQGRAGEAAAAFEAALAQVPRNGWALWGLAEARRAAGDDPAAAVEAFGKAWSGDRSLLALDRL